MSHTFTRPHAVCRATVTLGLILSLTAGVLAVLCGPGVPDAWWPKTGRAFSVDHAPAQPATTTTTSRASDACDLIVGPAKDYCQRPDAAAPTAAAGAGITRTGAVLLVPVVLGIAVLLRRNRRQS
ncbi:hypothetical protein OG949_40425 (plasmid) [Streptomyces scopuliridis]|uniref:hypothetical protein n=1 Tax=Streptomyces scopuliridis TaxID=452529 RepID=UPI002DDC848E|nr:hypothetical protein [Streptomyces scopuliridis]WSB39024.1 hypothetical protein OG949_40425 [Streptomyces scopuliridis]